MCLIRSIIANLCPIMLHFNGLDFSECRSKDDVINVFCRSVYIGISIMEHPHDFGSISTSHAQHHVSCI